MPCPGREVAGWGCWAAPGPLTCRKAGSLPLLQPCGCHRVRRPRACRVASAGWRAESLGYLLACGPRTLTRAHTWCARARTRACTHTHTVNPWKGSRAKWVNLFIILEQQRSF